jgi:hypothetical protein
MIDHWPSMHGPGFEPQHCKINNNNKKPRSHMETKKEKYSLESSFTMWCPLLCYDTSRRPPTDAGTLILDFPSLHNCGETDLTQGQISKQKMSNKWENDLRTRVA